MIELKTEIMALKQQHDAAQREIRTKEDRINQLIREIHDLVNIISIMQDFILVKFIQCCMFFDTYRKKGVVFRRRQ